jgi:hypothetical protein
MSILPLLNSIYLKDICVHAKQDSVAADAKPIMVSRPFELFDVSGELLLQKLDPIANVPSGSSGRERSCSRTSSEMNNA